MPLSDDPAKRERQLRNLPNLRGDPSPASWKPGTAPHLRSGYRSRRPSPLVLDPVVDEIAEALGDDAPVRDSDGGLPPADRAAIESAALDVLIVRRVHGF